MLFQAIIGILSLPGAILCFNYGYGEAGISLIASFLYNTYNGFKEYYSFKKWQRVNGPSRIRKQRLKPKGK
jgi:hypothetical protein